MNGPPQGLSPGVTDNAKAALELMNDREIEYNVSTWNDILGKTFYFFRDTSPNKITKIKSWQTWFLTIILELMIARLEQWKDAATTSRREPWFKQWFRWKKTKTSSNLPRHLPKASKLKKMLTLKTILCGFKLPWFISMVPLNSEECIRLFLKALLLLFLTLASTNQNIQRNSDSCQSQGKTISSK